MVDTNILLDWLLARDPQRTRLVEQLLASGKHLFIPELIIAELVFALEKYYQLTRLEVTNNLLIVLNERRFDIENRAFMLRVVTNLFAGRPSLSWIDCYLIQLSNERRIEPIWTFDRKLVNQSNQRARLLG